MIASNKKRRFHAPPLSILLCVALVQLSQGETLETDRGDILSGTLQSFDQGVLEFVTPLSPSPFQVKASTVHKIEFPRDASASSAHTEILTLSNGDKLPCNVISMDENTLNISTAYTGDISLSRDQIHSLRFGISRGKLLFEGGQQEGWISTGEAWTLNEKAQHFGVGALARELTLPDKVRFQFHLSWQKTPNFVFRFCAENNSARQKQNTYELTLNTEGVVINRYPNSTGQVLEIANLSSSEIKALREPNAKIHIDLHVCKSKGVVSLYLNSELAGKWHDPYEALSGHHIIFDNRSDQALNAVIDNIKVSSITGPIGSRFYDHEASASKTDILADSEGNALTGKLLTIQPGNSAKREVTLKSELSTEPLRVPEHRVSTLLFAGEPLPREAPRPRYLFSLREGGRLQVNEPSIADDSIKVTHPILGRLDLSRAYVQSITNTDNKQYEQ